MKKFICLLLSLITCLVVVGCDSSDGTMTIDVPAPWQSSAAADAYEKCVYAMTKTDKITGDVIANGQLTYELSFDHREESLSYSKLTATLTVTYNDKAPEADRGLTDVITSETIFLSTALTPKYSKKSAFLAPRTGESANLSYTLETDYAAGSSTMTLNGIDSTIDFSDKSLTGVYDNETYYYVVRACQGLAELSEYKTFKMANFMDMHLGDEYKVYTMQIAPNTDQKEETLYLEGLKGRFGLDSQGSVTASRIVASINHTLSGPPVELYYSKTPFTVGDGLETKKVLVKLSTYEYNIGESKLHYQNDYVLTDYSVNA